MLLLVLKFRPELERIECGSQGSQSTFPPPRSLESRQDDSNNKGGEGPVDFNPKYFSILPIHRSAQKRLCYVILVIVYALHISFPPMPLNIFRCTGTFLLATERAGAARIARGAGGGGGPICITLFSAVHLVTSWG